MKPHPSNRLANVRRRVNRARNYPDNTCPSSRHLHTIADALSRGQPYSMLTEEPEYCAESIYVVLEALWKARTLLARVDAAGEARRNRAARRAVLRGIQKALNR